MSTASEWTNIVNAVPSLQVADGITAQVSRDGGLQLVVDHPVIGVMGPVPPFSNLMPALISLRSEEGCRLAHWILDTFGEKPC